MGRTEEKTRKRSVSVINWLITLIISAIPGVNIIGFIAMAALAKNRSKKNFAIAALILCLLGVVLFVAAFLIFGSEIVKLATDLKNSLGK